jgi:hypothetical protein
VRCTANWRRLTAAALWRRGKGWRFKLLVAAALLTNLLALDATRSPPEGQGPLSGGGWQVLCRSLFLALVFLLVTLPLAARSPLLRVLIGS